MKIPTVYFGCSMRGGYGIVPLEILRRLHESIETVLELKLASKHQTQDGVAGLESKLTTPQIHDRDFGWIQGSDIGVFEISNPSLGVGAEISDTQHLGIPVLCLFSARIDPEIVSAYVHGKMGSAFIHTPFECHPYETVEDALNIIREFAERYGG